MQAKVAIALLQEEIRIFKPTHILFMAGMDWFEPFSANFEDVQFLGVNISRGSGKNKIFVEAKACYVSENESRCKVVVACRPEGRNKEGYVDAILKAFAE